MSMQRLQCNLHSLVLPCLSLWLLLHSISSQPVQASSRDPEGVL